MTDSGVVLVTGGAGFIGSHIVDGLVAAGRAVRVIDDLSSGSRLNLDPSVPVDVVDLADSEGVEIIARIGPSVIVHCAAQTSIGASFADPTADARTNILGSLNVIRGAIAAGTTRFVYVTTGGALYGHPKSLPCSEDDPVDPLSPYGWSKWVVERYLEMLLAPTTPWIALRLANVYGPRQRLDGETGVVAIFASRMHAGLPIDVHGDGEQTRDFVFVRDVARAIAAAVDGNASGPVNIGSGRETSINNVFADLAGLLGYDEAPRHTAPRPGDIRHSALDPRRAKTLLGWSAETDLKDGLAETCRWLSGAEG